MTIEEMIKLCEDNPEKYEMRFTWSAKLLTDVINGVSTKWTYHHDRTVTEEKIPDHPPVISKVIY